MHAQTTQAMQMTWATRATRPTHATQPRGGAWSEIGRGRMQ
jgi:hypothetical protein